jgi:hypothetical protein
MQQETKFCYKRKRGKEGGRGGEPTKPTFLRCQKSSCKAKGECIKKLFNFLLWLLPQIDRSMSTLLLLPNFKRINLKNKNRRWDFVWRKDLPRNGNSSQGPSLYSSASASFQERRRRPVISTGHPLYWRHLISSGLTLVIPYLALGYIQVCWLCL